jgi:hypothetical protein
MRDVEYLLHKGTYRLKALTPGAKRVFMQLLEVPLEDRHITDAFLTTTPEKFPRLIESLQKVGLTTELPKVEPPPLGPPPTHLWTW